MKRKKKRVNNNNNNNTNNEIMIQNIVTKEKDRKKYISYTMKYNLIKQIITDSRFERKDSKL